jgi:hypothetical protein
MWWGKNRSQHNLRHYRDICLIELSKTIKSLRIFGFSADISPREY